MSRAPRRFFGPRPGIEFQFLRKKQWTRQAWLCLSRPPFASAGEDPRCINQTIPFASHCRQGDARHRRQTSVRGRSAPFPRMTESTAMSGSCARSYATTRGSGIGFAASLRTFPSTRYFKAHQWIRSRRGRKSPSTDRPVASRRRPRWAEPHAGRGDSRRD
jgi:hypothetical protein